MPLKFCRLLTSNCNRQNTDSNWDDDSLENRAYTDSTYRISFKGEAGGHMAGETKAVPGSRRKD